VKTAVWPGSAGPGKGAACFRQLRSFVCDELLGAIGFGLLDLEQALELIHLKPKAVELVLTGRNADQRLIEAADLVTEMREIKHYYCAGVPARVGIEL